MKQSNVQIVLCAFLLIAALCGSLKECQSLPVLGNLAKTLNYEKVEQKLGQTLIIAEKNQDAPVAKAAIATEVQIVNTTAKRFFLSSAITQHFINHTINTII